MKAAILGCLSVFLAGLLPAATTSSEGTANALACKKECWDKTLTACGDGSGACQANSKACGASGGAAESWGAAALYGAAALALVAVAWYFVDKALDSPAADLPQAPEEAVADFDLLPSRAAGGA